MFAFIVVKTIVVNGDYIEPDDSPNRKTFIIIFERGNESFFNTVIEVVDNTIARNNGDQIGIVMSRITDHGVFPEPNWNLGKPLLISADGANLEKTISKKWGWRYEDDSLEEDEDKSGWYALYQNDVE